MRIKLKLEAHRKELNLVHVRQDVQRLETQNLEDMIDLLPQLTKRQIRDEILNITPILQGEDQVDRVEEVRPTAPSRNSPGQPDLHSAQAVPQLEPIVMEPEVEPLTIPSSSQRTRRAAHILKAIRENERRNWLPKPPSMESRKRIQGRDGVKVRKPPPPLQIRSVSPEAEISDLPRRKEKPVARVCPILRNGQPIRYRRGN